MKTSCPESLLRLEATESSFLQEFLRGALGWPIPADATSLQEISYEWSLADLHLERFAVRLAAPVAWQLASLDPAMSCGVFLLQVREHINLDASTGVRMIINQLLQSLRQSAQRPAHLPYWRATDLLLIFTCQWESYSFIIYNPDPQGKRKTALAKFSWQLSQRRDYIWRDHLRHLTWPEDLSLWRACWLQGFHTYLEQTSISPRRADQRETTQETLERRVFLAALRGDCPEEHLAEDHADMPDWARQHLMESHKWKESDDPADWLGRMPEKQWLHAQLITEANAPLSMPLVHWRRRFRQRKACQRLLCGQSSEKRMTRDLRIVFGEEGWRETDYTFLQTAVRGKSDDYALCQWTLTESALRDLALKFPDLAGESAEGWRQTFDT